MVVVRGQDAMCIQRANNVVAGASSSSKQRAIKIEFAL